MHIEIIIAVIIELSSQFPDVFLPHFTMFIVRKILLLNAVLLLWWTLVNSSVQEAAIPSFNFIDRATWGAQSPKSPSENLRVNPPNFVIIHHSDIEGCTSQALCQAKVRSIQNYHMNHNNWSDIGYNFLIGEDGNVYEGRGWGKKGAHSPRYNDRSIGICFIGKFEKRIPQPAALKSSQSLMDFGVSSGKLKADYSLLGHRQTKATTCPGTSLYELIQTWLHWRRL